MLGNGARRRTADVYDLTKWEKGYEALDSLQRGGEPDAGVMRGKKTQREK